MSTAYGMKKLTNMLEGSWTCSTDLNKVSVTNNSIKAVTAKISYESVSNYTEISGTLLMNQVIV